MDVDGSSPDDGTAAVDVDGSPPVVAGAASAELGAWPDGEELGASPDGVPMSAVT